MGVPREYGGEFSAADAARTFAEGPLLRELLPGATLWGSGRAALRALILTKRWRRIWIPSYLCPEVREALEDIEVATYVDHPLRSPGGLPASVSEGDVVFRVNYFGLRGAEEADRSSGEVIEDHTHDPHGPWARASRATFALASLRKTAPVPDGGVLWSPARASLPRELEPTAAHLAAADAKLEAMRMKTQFLRGGPVAKSDYRTLSKAADARIGSLSGPHPETRAFFDRTSPLALAAARRAAWEKLAKATTRTVAPRGEPFALVLDLETEKHRDAVHHALVAEGVFPSLLWPLSWWRSDRESREVSKRLLSISCDFRYPSEVVDEVVSLLQSFA
jgi:hypothetical protein